MKNTDFTTRR